MNRHNDMAIFPIKIVRERTGLTGRQIRYYEEKSLIKPHRTRGGQRRYTEDDITVLLKIRHLIKTGLNIEGVKAKLEQNLDKSKDNDDINEDNDFLVSKDKHLTSIYPLSDRAKIEKILDDE